MLSAFGVDHGEISKIRPPKLPKLRGMEGGAPPTAAQKRTQGHNPGAKTRPRKVKEALHGIGEADISLKGIGNAAGGATRGVGGFLEKRPGLTGAALVGGGGAGGYHVLRQKEPKRKSS